MRLEKLRIRHLGPFSDFTVDLTELPPEAQLIAVTGENGSGKTFMMEFWSGGACHRTVNRRRKKRALHEVATARDSLLEATIHHGQRWTIRHNVDAVSRNGTSLVLTEDGTPAYESTKVSDFQSWSAKHLLPREVLYSCLVTSQGRLGFLDLGESDKKAVILRACGAERPLLKVRIDRLGEGAGIGARRIEAVELGRERRLHGFRQSRCEGGAWTFIAGIA